jgi:hypothetical protein
MELEERSTVAQVADAGRNQTVEEFLQSDLSMRDGFGLALEQSGEISFFERLTQVHRGWRSLQAAKT